MRARTAGLYRSRWSRSIGSWTATASPFARFTQSLKRWRPPAGRSRSASRAAAFPPRFAWSRRITFPCGPLGSQSAFTAKRAPDTSLGLTMVAFTHWLDVFRGWAASPAKSLELAAQAAEPALRMEDADGQAHAVMGHIHLLRREHAKALEVAEQAVCLRPSCANSNAQFGNILYYCGRPAEAADRVRQAMRFSPIHPPFFKAVLASSCKEMREWDEAARTAKELLRMRPDDADPRLVLVEAALAAGDKAGAAQYAEEIRKLQPQFSLAAWAQRQPYRDPAVLERILARLREAGLS